MKWDETGQVTTATTSVNSLTGATVQQTGCKRKRQQRKPVATDISELEKRKIAARSVAAKRTARRVRLRGPRRPVANQNVRSPLSGTLHLVYRVKMEIGF